MKRGEISMEVIIVAAIALLVLVILSVLIIRAGGNASQGTGCQGVGGQCTSACSEGYSRSWGHSCPNKDDVCCVSESGSNPA